MTPTMEATAREYDWSKLLARLDEELPAYRRVWDVVDSVIAMGEDRSEIESLVDERDTLEGRIIELHDRLAHLHALCQVLAEMGLPDRGMCADVAFLVEEAYDYAKTA